jgi:hypothetical protein
MSEEARIEVAYARYLNPIQPGQWHGLSPDEELMAAEDGPCPIEVRADLQELFLVYCFADTQPEEWTTVAARAAAVLRTVFPGAFFQRDWSELDAIRHTVRTVAAFPLSTLISALRPHRDLMEGIITYYFPDQKQWLKNGVQNLYLVARCYQSGLVTRWDGQELTYHRLAAVFGEIPAAATGRLPQAAWEQACDRARSRWSARAKKLILQPILATHGSPPALYGKSATVRKKYAAAARGNQNRRAT